MNVIDLAWPAVWIVGLTSLVIGIYMWKGKTGDTRRRPKGVLFLLFTLLCMVVMVIGIHFLPIDVFGIPTLLHVMLGAWSAYMAWTAAKVAQAAAAEPMEGPQTV